jgi:hypothetical protein
MPAADLRLALVMFIVIGFAAAAVYAGYSPVGAMLFVGAVGVYTGTRAAIQRLRVKDDPARSNAGLPVSWATGSVAALNADDLMPQLGGQFSSRITPLSVPTRAAGRVPLATPAHDGSRDEQRPPAHA